jgi:hypothetical protein
MAVRDQSTGLDELRRLQGESERIEQERLRTIAKVRRAGVSWDDIGRAMRLSRQSVWQRYAPLVEAVEAGWSSATLTEEEALALAREALAEVRNARRARSRAAG